MNFDKIPQEMKAMPNWVCWKYVERKGERTKFPYTPTTGKQAQVNNPATWTTFDTAARTEGYEGIGFVLTDSPFVAIDMDDSIKDGELQPEAVRIIARMGSYTEKSPSGNGIHIIGRAVGVPTKGRKIPGIEVYPSGRYVTMTGDTLPDREQIADITAPFSSLLDEVESRKRQRKSPQGRDAAPVPALHPVDMVTDELIARIRKSKQGELFKRLFDDGDTAAYGGDDSSADMALMNILPFWTGGDPVQMEEIFSMSALARREKWQERADYRKMTIDRALKDWNGQQYDPGAMQRKQLEQHEERQGRDRTIIKKPEWPVTEVMDDGTVKPIKQAWENTAYLLDALGIQFRYNLLTKEVDARGGGLDGLSFDSAITTVRGILYKNRLKTSRQDTVDNIGTIAERNQYSPVCDYLNKCMGAWDGQDRIGQLFSCFELDDEFPQDEDFLQLLLRRWLISCARMAFNNGDEAAQGVLILVGGQGIGKTRFMYTILPLPEWGADGQTLDPAVKDDILTVMRFWIVELGEINSTLRKEKQDRLKQFFTHKTDTLRKPYKRASEQIPRRTVFIGTVNGDGFLKDSTGNRRYWPIAVKRVNNDTDIDINQLWGQVMHLAFVKKEPHWLNEEELEKLGIQNAPFKKITSEEQSLLDCLDWDSPVEEWRWATSTDLCDALGVPRSRNSMIGKALQGLAQKDPRIQRPTNHINGKKYKIPRALPNGVGRMFL